MKNMEPYRLFFPVGWLLGFIGVLIWIPWILQPQSSYPGLIHPELMIGGFLLLYSFGFLTTAIPRFTATQDMNISEKKMALVLFVFLLLGFIFALKPLVFAADLSLVLYLVLFAAKRIQKRNAEPPPSFVFVGFGLLLAFLGLGLQFLGSLESLSPELTRASRPLLYVGFMLSLVLGIGSRLIPGILGHQPGLVPKPPGPEQQEKKSFLSLWLQVPPAMKVAGILFLASFAVDLILLTPILGDALRALICLFIAFQFWRLHRLPRNTGIMPYFLWLSAWSILISLVLMPLFPSFRLHVAHLLYISGLGLMTVMVSTRVTLSHSGQDLMPEKKSWALLCTGILILAAALARFSGAFSSSFYNVSLLIASVLWCLGLIFWMARFGKLWTLHAKPH